MKLDRILRDFELFNYLRYMKNMLDCTKQKHKCFQYLKKKLELKSIFFEMTIKLYFSSHFWDWISYRILLILLYDIKVSTSKKIPSLNSLYIHYKKIFTSIYTKTYISAIKLCEFYPATNF